MDILETLDIENCSPASLALGAFDGLHLGHRAVLEAALGPGAGPRLSPQVFTFKRSPSGEPSLITGEDKAAILSGMGMERVYSMDFRGLRDMEAEGFARDILLGRLNARRLCCGEDFRFGRGARGDVELLARLCGEYGAQLMVVPPVLDGGEKVSSTRIRRAVAEGDILTANRLLGRPFGFNLEVIHGNHIGTGLGTPTINQALPEELALPRFGVYAAWCETESGRYYGVCNIGVKPTVGSDRVLAETWMPEFDGDLYGQRVRVELMDFIRAERKFSSLDQLKEEIRRNAIRAKEITGAL